MFRSLNRMAAPESSGRQSSPAPPASSIVANSKSLIELALRFELEDRSSETGMAPFMRPDGVAARKRCAMPTCRYLYRVTASQVCGGMSTQILSKRSGASFDVLGLPTQTTPFARVGQKPRRVWMPINDLLGFLDTFRLSDSWPVFVEIECFSGHSSDRSTFSDRYRSGTFAGPA